MVPSGPAISVSMRAITTSLSFALECAVRRRFVGEYAAHPELPGRDTVIMRATTVRAHCRKLAGCLRRRAELPAPRRGNVLDFRAGLANWGEGMTARVRARS